MKKWPEPTCRRCRSPMNLIGEVMRKDHNHVWRLGYWQWRCERNHSASYHYTRKIPPRYIVEYSNKFKLFKGWFCHYQIFKTNQLKIAIRWLIQCGYRVRVKDLKSNNYISNRKILDESYIG